MCTSKVGVLGTLLLLAGGAGGCQEAKSEQSQTASQPDIAMENATAAGGLLISYTTADQAKMLPDLTSGAQPTGFHWVTVGVSREQVASLTSSGLSVDMSDPAVSMSFSQVYQGTCNPATQDFNNCWLFESYTSGDPGLTGHISLVLKGIQVIGNVDITWAGLTDRFGDPEQWHQHGTIANINIPLSSNTSIGAAGGAQ